jgi:hypothetical protein
MHIDSYEFGRIVIDGETYTNDVIILDGQVKDNWWRKNGHSLCAADLDEVVSFSPSVFVMGCGASGMLKVPDETVQFLQEQGIKLEVAKTAQAVKRVNELLEGNERIAAGLHLTC